MKLQAAIDRVSMEKAEELIRQIGSNADVIEIGTSLIKDFGLSGSVERIRRKFPLVKLLADIKICDEGAYEARRAFEAGADFITVMGFSADATIRACADEAAAFGKEYMIDLMSCDGERAAALVKEFPGAVFCIHLPSDVRGAGLKELVIESIQWLGEGVRIAAAGGVTIAFIPALRSAGVETGIVGSGITKAENVQEAAREYYEAMKG